MDTSMAPGRALPPGRTRPRARTGVPDAIAAALRTLRRSGTDIDEARFAAAHACGCCYLCKVPYHAMLDDCPCPHWLVIAASVRHPVGPIFATYSLPAVLAFVLLYAGACTARRRLDGGTASGAATLSVLVDRRVLAFAAPVATDDDATLTMRRTTRGREDMLVHARCDGADAALLAALAGIAGSAPRGRRPPAPMTPRSRHLARLAGPETEDFNNAHGM